jgi:hypothetical protein
MFAFVLPTRLLLLLLPFIICSETPRATAFDLMMVSLSSGLNIFVDAKLLLHFLVLHHIFLHHCMARTRGKTCHFLY